MALITITEPTFEPLDLEEVKDDLRVIGEDDNWRIEQYIKSARVALENQLRRALCTQTLEATFYCFPDSRVIPLERPPLQSVTSIKYKDVNDQEVTLSSGDYTVDDDSTPGRVVLNWDKAWPQTYDTPNAIRVRYVAGYETAEKIPYDIKQACYFLVAHWFANREPVVNGSVQEMPKTLDYLLFPNRVW